MSKLRLGPIVDEAPLKVTIEIPGALARLLSDYAELHASETGLVEPIGTARLIVAMLDQFVASDRGFSRSRSQAARSRQSGVARAEQ